MNYPFGSLWRKWDLHVHTPASIFHNYPGTPDQAWEEFLADLEALPSEFKVIGINDYLFLDGYKRVLQEKEKGRLGNIDLILPVIELRLDKFVGHDSHFQRVNFHVIFDAIDPGIIETQFINQLSREFILLPEHDGLKGRWSAIPTRQSLNDFGQLIIDAAPADRKHQYGSPLKEGFNNFNVALENIKDALSSHYFQDKYLTAVGKTEWDAIQWNNASIAEKRNVISNADIVFTAAETVERFHNSQTSLKEANVNDRLFDCSDAHWLSNSEDKDRIGNCFTWIKADTTFAGLQHAINEYEKRIFVGDSPEKMAKVQTNRTKYIRKIAIKKLPDSDLTEPWFDCEIPLNSDLVVIIGNKGSGKSALADAIGLLGNSRQVEHFSFLNDQKFRDPRDNKASHFEAALTWMSGINSVKGLNVNPDPDTVETVKYLPQNYIEKLCNEIVTGGDSEFDRELKQIIFSHVGQSDRLGYDTLDDVIRYLTSETQDHIRALADQIHSINQDIVQYEERSTESHRTHLESQLRLKKEELEAHDRSKPETVPEPTQSEELQQTARQIRTVIEEKKTELNDINKQISELDRNRAGLTRKVAILDKATSKLDNFRLQYEEFKRVLAIDLSELNIEPELQVEELVNLTTDRGKLTRIHSQFANDIAAIDVQLDSGKEDSLVSRKSRLELDLQNLQNSLDEPNRNFVAYQTALENWNTQRANILGDIDTSGSIAWLESRLENLSHIPAQLEALQKQRSNITREIHQEIKKLANSYRSLYRPVQEFVEQQKISSAAIPLSFQVSIIEEGFAQSFFEKINRQIKGTYSGIEESNKLMQSKLKSIDFNDEDIIIEFVDYVYESLHSDMRSDVLDTSVQVNDQLRSGVKPEDVYDYLYALSFLIPRYKLHFGDHEIYQLSPGERGLLLLVFYLLIDKDVIPLVIDQPEENLDNQTIYEILVSCLTEAKRRRQVILVTHNPNLAVVCDAEQVIYAHRDTTTNTITYQAGAIENPDMNKHVIDVLEGTRPAFNNRDSKYFV